MVEILSDDDSQGLGQEQHQDRLPPPVPPPTLRPAPVESKDEGSARLTQLRHEWEEYSLRNGATVTGGKVFKLVPIVADSENASPFASGDLLGGSSGGKKSARTHEPIEDPEGQRLYDSLQILEDDYNRFIKGASGSGAVVSYAESEENKSDEITRQFKDFLDRAEGVYDLMDSERDYAMAGDDQNIQNQAAVKAGIMPAAAFGSYGTPRGPGYSARLAPTVPDTVASDYRLNQSVGLDGPQGFEDYENEPSFLPRFADGTDPDPELANIPPELLQMVGQPAVVHGNPNRMLRQWPWGRGVAINA